MREIMGKKFVDNEFGIDNINNIYGIWWVVDELECFGLFVDRSVK